MRLFIWSVLAVVTVTLCGPAPACINDSKTWSQEKREQPDLAQAILHPKIEKPDVKELHARIQKLNAAPKTNDPAWWNDLAGAYLRLNQPSEAVKLLEPVTNRFSGDYGIHANLGTAYHLLGRYPDAEKEIRRDLEINPDGHGGLEKYHSALLQYLSRDTKYRFRHLYVDEFSVDFIASPGRYFKIPPMEKGTFTNNLTGPDRQKLEAQAEEFSRRPPNAELSGDEMKALAELADSDEDPEYESRWDLNKDPKLEQGVIYMAGLNPREPACQIMLGALAANRGNVNMAKTAYLRAIALGSPQAVILNAQIDRLKRLHYPFFGLPHDTMWPILGILVVISCYIYSKYTKSRKRRRKQEAQLAP